MKIAAIDIGTNSIHMIVANVRGDGSFEIIEREKAMIRLGAGGLGGRALSEASVSAALQTLMTFRRLADSRGAEEIVAAATSAVREAPNGGELLAAIERETGIHAVAISGTAEARLIHLAAVYGVHVADGTAVVIDIGGGSTEITLGPVSGPQMARSMKLGVIRLTERFIHSDPLSEDDERHLVRHISGQIREVTAAFRTAGFDRVIGTSGTILSLGGLASPEPEGDAEELHHRVLAARDLRRLRKRLVAMDLEERLNLPGLDPRRADLIVAGAVLLDTILRRLGADEITLSDFSLREGLVLDFMLRNAAHIAQAGRYPDIRRRSVFELAERYSVERGHAEQVARLALMLFDQTRGAHGLDDRAREWLEYAAILHDSGLLIGYARHHRHSYYLVKNGGLRGFTPAEVETIALVTRYHRRAAPKRSHEGFATLEDAERRAVRALAAMLRLAETLDRSHGRAVVSLELVDRGRHCTLTLATAGDIELETWAAGRELRPLEALLGKEIRLETRKLTDAEHADDAAPVPRQTVRGRGHRRIGQDDAARAAGEVAERGRPARLRH